MVGKLVNMGCLVKGRRGRQAEPKAKSIGSHDIISTPYHLQLEMSESFMENDFVFPSVTMSTSSPQTHICQCRCYTREAYSSRGCSLYIDLYIFCGNDRKLGVEKCVKDQFLFLLTFSQGLK